ncbi:FecCD family ABC transporter permease [Luteococcus peritonei]|uniref:FecCD family ABC transporter permease n=1 Tax=Luteococcus peritonei TaxID=88874 RepID=A0ABW4RUZ3_9ACTN
MSTANPRTPAPSTTRPGMLRMPVVGTPVRRDGLLRGLLLLALTALLAVWAMGLGDYPLSPGQVLSALVREDGFASTVVREWRAPRVLAALLLGGALAVSGAVFQSLTRNPLGSPDVIGFSTGAYSGVLLATTVLGGSFASTQAGALLGGLATAAVVYLFSLRQGGVQGYRLVVVGIGVTAMLHALNLFLLMRVQAEVAMAASIWGAGTLSLVGWPELLPAIGCLLLLTPAVALLAAPLRQLELGDDAASAHGVPVERTRIALMVVAVALVAVATAAAGPIAFVALAAPQIAHRLLGGAGVPLVGSALCGALLLLASDVAAQHLLGSDVPVGIVTVVGGGAYLLALLVAQVRRS